MEKMDGVADTLFIPLAARIAVSKEFPEFFRDERALELEPSLPPGAFRGAFQYANMASVARSFHMDRMISEFLDRHESASVVCLGVGLETTCNRVTRRRGTGGARWYGVDLPEVIATRRALLGTLANETLISGDLFTCEWAKELDATLPTALVVSGVFQYFHEEEVVEFVRKCKSIFPRGELIFDATSRAGLRFTNWFVRRTGNRSAPMYFGVDDSEAFARKCGARLMEEQLFFSAGLDGVRRKLSLMTRIFMRLCDRKKRALVLRLALN